MTMSKAQNLVIVAALLLGCLAWAGGCSKEEPAQTGATAGAQPDMNRPDAQAAPEQPTARTPQPRKEGVVESMVNAPADYIGTVVRTRPYAQDKLAKAELANFIRNFYALEGRYPESLQELEESRGSKLPKLPRGLKYQYDPATGALETVPVEQ